ncbi:transmembrane protein 81 isoform X2 [Takifugu rubripes]|uniref:transmembrane protein 81 isoform X2 n=1 Tax=Takifugu rubripes TaxID=31033 RepID=UPI001145E7B3|nr:transmembrane protein 81 isoform X2 [Takifugu rubripes]
MEEILHHKMAQHKTTRLLLFVILLFLFHPISPAEVEPEVEVIVGSSHCSTTCGLGLRNQTLCLLKDSQAALDEGDAEVSEKCRVRTVKCLESWQCGLQTMTMTSGQRVELDCLGEVMKAMGRFSWRVAWRYARGIITSDDSLFAQWKALQLDQVVLDPIREENSGTYRCDVQDTSHRRVKRIYWGIRVLPVGILNLDYDSSAEQWNATESQQEQRSDGYGRHVLLYTLLTGLSISVVGAGLILLGIYFLQKRKGCLQN